eukprot:903424-Prorocentrum_minimum.AAC.2
MDGQTDGLLCVFTSHTAAKSAALIGSVCFSNSSVTTSKWCSTTLNLFSSNTWEGAKWRTYSSSSYGRNGLRHSFGLPAPSLGGACAKSIPSRTD